MFMVVYGGMYTIQTHIASSVYGQLVYIGVNYVYLFSMFCYLFTSAALYKIDRKQAKKQKHYF